MKKRLPTFLMGVVTAILISGLSLSALAASGMIKLEVNPANVLVNGEEFKPKDAKGNDVLVFVYNGTTYAPLRALAEAYGLEVSYNAEKGIATVDTPIANAEPTTDSSDIPALSTMTYSEFTKALTLSKEIGEKLTSPSETIILYHYHLTFGSGLDEDKFLNEWDAFLNSDSAQIYLDDLLLQYAQLAPNNTVVIHLEYNNKSLKVMTDWPTD